MIPDNNPDDYVKAIKTVFDNQSDPRVCAIVAASYLEDYLGRLIQAMMRGLNSKLKDKLFGSNGRLSEMSVKIDLARALGLIDEDTHTDLVSISRIRNRFAHNIHIDSFEHDEISKLCNDLKTYINFKSGRRTGSNGNPLPESFMRTFGDSNRGKFAFSSMMLGMTINNRLATARSLRKPSRDK